MKKLIIVFFFLSSFWVIAQKEDKVWIMGYGDSLPIGGIKLSFEIDSLHKSWFSIPLWMNVTDASICDTSGNLLFYTNGWMIANNNLDTMMNGDSLSPCQYNYDFGPGGLSVIQGALILPLPNDTNIYYLFHEPFTYSDYAENLQYSTIDMRLDSNRGAVVNKNVTLIDDSLDAGMITAVRHANGRDWWVTVPRIRGDSIYIFMLSPAGISDIHIQQIAPGSSFREGQAVFSPDGSIYARVRYNSKSKVDILDFDRCAGMFSNLRTINYNELNWGGVGISPNSNVLYVTANDTVFQYDLTAGNIAGTEQVIAVYDSFASPFGSTFELVQIAPDGKIYIACGNGENVMHVIDYPDSLGTACHFCQHCIQLPAYNAFSIPNYPNFRLGALVSSPCDTLQVNAIETPNNISGKIFPNPARDWIIFEPSKALTEKAELQLYNILGKRISSQTMNPMQEQYDVNVSGLAEGMYFVKINNKKGSLFNGKVMVVK